MKLADALAQLRDTADQTHKFWGYYQGVTAAAVAFIWAADRPQHELVVGLVVAYLVFAALNCWLVVSSQSAARNIWLAIQHYQPPPDEPLNDAWRPIMRLNQPIKPIRVGTMHVTISLAATWAIHARLATL